MTPHRIKALAIAIPIMWIAFMGVVVLGDISLAAYDRAEVRSQEREQHRLRHSEHAPAKADTSDILTPLGGEGDLGDAPRQRTDLWRDPIARGRWERRQVSAYSHGCTCDQLVRLPGGRQRCDTVRPPGEYAAKNGEMPVAGKTVAAPSETPIGAVLAVAYKGIITYRRVTDRMTDSRGQDWLDLFVGDCATADDFEVQDVFVREIQTPLGAF